MQTTLLGLAIAAIIALLAALIGPFFVDWSAYRAQFETEASRLVGLPVRVTGSIDVRLLPTPSLRLNGVRIGRPDEEPIRADALGIEMALGPLVRGQLRASEMLVSGPQLTVALGKDGRAELPAGTLGFDLQNIAIDRLTIEDAKLILVHASSNRELVFDKLWFSGEARSLAGSFRGDGAFVYGKELFGYRVNATRQDSGAIKTRFALDPSERALSIQGEGLFTNDNGVPRFEGTLTALRPVGTVLAGGRAVVNEPWRLTSQVKADPDSALLENIDFQYGPDERALKLTGTAALKYETAMRLDGVLSASQFDIDRLIAKEGQPPATPYRTFVAFADSFGRAFNPPIPVQLGISVDSVKIGGGTVQTLRGDLRTADDVWLLDDFEFRVPGVTQVQLSGRAALSREGLSFRGPADVSSADPRQLLAWLEGRDMSAFEGLGRPVRARGEVVFGSDKIAIERLHAGIDGRAIDGGLIYAWPTGTSTGRLDAQLTAKELDLDGLVELGRAAFANDRFERPGEISLSIDIAKARLGGTVAQNAKAKLTLDGSGLTIERFGLADLGGVALQASGRIDTTAAVPKGELTVDLDGRDLSGVSSLLARYAPDHLQPLRTILDRLGSATLRATLAVNDTGDNNKMTARLAVDGRSNGLRLALKSALTAATADLGNGQFHLAGEVEAPDGARLLRIAGIEGAEGEEPGSGRLMFRADGPLGGKLQVAATVASPALDAQVNGTMNATFSAADVAGAFDLDVTKADLVTLFPALRAARRALPSALSSHVSVSGTSLSFEKMTGKVAGSSIEGRLALDLGEARSVQGTLSTDVADGAAIVALLSGAHAPRAEQAGWPAEPFRKDTLPNLTGRIDLRGARVSLAPSLAMKDAAATLRLAPNVVSFEEVSGELEGGHVEGEIALRRMADGLNAKGHFTLKDADAAALIAVEGRPVSGKVGLRMNFEGVGLSPKALIGSLSGSGTVSIARARLEGLDPRAFSSAMRAADQGVGLEPARIAPVVTRTLDAGSLEIAHAEGALAMAAGQIRLSTMIARAEGAELAISGRLDLAAGHLDTRIVLAGEDAGNGAGRPEIAVALRGDPFAPQRTIDVSSLSGWLALRAVDQQAKKLEAIERARAASPPVDTLPPPKQTPAPAPASAARPSPPETSPSEPRIVAPRERAATPTPESKTRADIPERAAPLPPPLVIAPAPGVLRRQAPPPANQPANGRTF